MVVSKDVSYASGNDSVQAYLAYPDDSEKHPGVVLIHEIFVRILMCKPAPTGI